MHWVAAWIPLCPLISFIFLLAFGQQGYAKRPWIGCLGILASFFLVLYYVMSGFSSREPVHFFEWFSIGDATTSFAFRLDSLGLSMALMISFIAFWISFFSIQFMKKDPESKRYFAWLNLFVAMMLILVLSDDLVFLYVGWEGVGLCSYVLIGFWYEQQQAATGAMKAFLMTKIADVFLLIGIWFSISTLHTTQLIQIGPSAQQILYPENVLMHAIPICFLIGAMGKSAQFPFHPWLLGAMAGPTPISALIHAATMVIAGVYLIARLHALFELSSLVSVLTLLVGMVSLLFGALCAFFQKDLKKILAYSTISQIGFMFVGLGSKAYLASVFHLMTHAFFKSLLFLCAGVIGYVYHAYDTQALSGMRKQLPWTYAALCIGASSLAGFPFITSGFYSKETILHEVYGTHGLICWLFVLLGAFLTVLYAFRMVFLLGASKSSIALTHDLPTLYMHLPLCVLSIFALGFGFLEPPEVFFPVHGFFQLLWDVLPFFSYPISHQEEWILLGSTVAVVLFGIYLVRRWHKTKRLSLMHFQMAERGFLFEHFYMRCLVPIYQRICQKLSADIAFYTADAVIDISFLVHQSLSVLQNGRLHRYAAFMLVSVVILITLMVFR